MKMEVKKLKKHGISMSFGSISMKKLLTLLISVLVSFNSNGEELNSLFGLSLYENAEEYVSSSYIESNKVAHGETLGGYFALSVTDKIMSKNPYASEYIIVIDINNDIHSIAGTKEFPYLSICQDALETLSSALEESYEIDFDYWEPTMPTFKIYSHYHRTGSGDYYAIQCNEDYEDSSIVSQIYLDSKALTEAINEFYKVGL